MSDKFDSLETEALYNLSLDGGGDEECGDVDSWEGHFCLLRGPFEGEALGGHGYVGAILQTTTQGFVYGETFRSKKKLMERWKECERVCESVGDDGED